MKKWNEAGRVMFLRVAAGTAIATGSLLGGCEKSFMDPSVTGRWEATPTVMPILDRLAAIEDDTGELVETSEPVPADLIPLPQAYRLGPGDQVDITLYDLIETGRPETYARTIDPRGTVELPQLGRLQIGGLTTEEATEVIRNAMKRLVAEPLVLVDARGQRQQTYNIIGEVQSPGPYFIPRADYRLLEALTSGGRFDQNGEEIYVIRQVPLSEEVTQGQVPQTTPPSTDPQTQPQPSGQDLNRLIDQIAPEPGAQPTTPTTPTQPTSQPPAPAVPLPGSDTSPSSPAPSTTPAAQPETGIPQGQAPIVPLPDNDAVRQNQQAPQPLPQADDEGQWIFVNGKWVRSGGRAARATPAPGGESQNLITQRIIRIPVRDLLAGKQSVNIIIRPGDVIRVPSPPTGLVYVAGQVARPGPYQLPLSGGLTLTRAITSAGGYGNLAVPSRIDLTRIVGPNRQATIMLDGEAIDNRTQPDVWLKPNDEIRVGTTWWALPLAVIRNGFRASYGFGFVLDRNISNDLFGPPPLNALGQ